jgi:hypothetical protein
MLKYLANFARFWYDFIIGDDWVIALAVGVTLALLLVAGRHSLWWVLPLVVVAALGNSLWRATR